MHTQPAAPSPAGPRQAPPSPHRARMSGKARVRVVVPVLVRPARMGTEVAGVGCPSSRSDGISLADTSTGPGWTTAGGGWTGNGCDGSSVWSMDPNGNQASPSTLTWFFYPSMQASSCRLAVFVPSQNALGVGNYQISAGSGWISMASPRTDATVLAGTETAAAPAVVRGAPSAPRRQSQQQLAARERQRGRPPENSRRNSTHLVHGGVIVGHTLEEAPAWRLPSARRGKNACRSRSRGILAGGGRFERVRIGKFPTVAIARAECELLARRLVKRTICDLQRRLD